MCPYSCKTDAGTGFAGFSRSRSVRSVQSTCRRNTRTVLAENRRDGRLARPHVPSDSIEVDVVRVAAVGDLHCTKTSAGAFQPLFAQVAEQADVLLLCGDLTDYGLVEEAMILVKEIPQGMKTPIVAVLGNHDFESNQQARSKNPRPRRV